LYVFVATTVVLQVAFDVIEAGGAKAIAVVVIVAMVAGIVTILVIDFAAIKSSAMLLIKNVRQIAMKL
jgi:hypothetical protein